MAGREHRKALPSNRPGSRRKPGEPWDPEDWTAFKDWALQNGARVIWEGNSHEHLRWVDYVGYEHRDDGPAVICMDGLECWFKNGHRHREDGPAIIRSLNSTRPVSEPAAEYWLDGVRYTDETFTLRIR